MQVKLVLEEGKSLPVNTIFQAEGRPAEAVFLSELQAHCTSVFGIPAEALALYDWKGRPIAKKEMASNETLADISIQHLDKLIVKRRMHLSPPTVVDLNISAMRVQRKSVQVSGDVRYTDERLVAEPSQPAIKREVSHARNLKMHRHISPRDNNTLFLCMSELLFNGAQSVRSMRWITVEAVTKRPELFTKDLLGMPVDEYGKRVLSLKSWGGLIELSSLALEFKVAIAVWDVKSKKLIIHGEDYDQCNGRYYLVCDGPFYDWISASDKEKDFKLFSHTDENIIRKVKQCTDIQISRTETRRVPPPRSMPCPLPVKPSTTETQAFAVQDPKIAFGHSYKKEYSETGPSKSCH